MKSVVHCINGPKFAQALNKAMGKRATNKASLSTFSSALEDNAEDITRLAEESGSSFDWLRHLQTALLGERAVIVASGWTREGEYDGVWLWERDGSDQTLLRGMRKAQASDLLNDRIIPIRPVARFRLAPLKDSQDVRVPLLTGLVADERWSDEVRGRRDYTPGRYSL